MTVLYPRLLPSEADRLFEELHSHEVGGHAAMVSDHSLRSVYAATGGRRVTRDELMALRESILVVANANGFPSDLKPARKSDFDFAVALLLLNESQLSPGEAGQRQVWAFLCLVLMPDVCAWRWPLEGKTRYTADRFKGTDLTRNTLARLWTRAYVLREPGSPDPFELMRVLGEADIDHVMSRRSAIGACPAFVRAIVRGHRDDAPRTGDDPAARAVLRESLMRLSRLVAFLDVDGLSNGELDRLVMSTRVEARRALSGSS